jgi:hypothetical protein
VRPPCGSGDGELAPQEVRPLLGLDENSPGRGTGGPGSGDGNPVRSGVRPPRSLAPWGVPSWLDVAPDALSLRQHRRDMALEAGIRGRPATFPIYEVKFLAQVEAEGRGGGDRPAGS